MINLIPRFYYTLPSWVYLKLLFQNIFGRKNKGSYGANFWFNNSRVGLKLLLNSISDAPLRIGVQAYTCHTVFQAIAKCGHKIVFIDVTDEFQLDLDDLTQKCDNLDVLIVTHTFGIPDRIDEIKTIIGERILIEDCAHAYLSKYKGREVGLLGDAAIFSSGLAKFPAVGIGGHCYVSNMARFPKFQENYKAIDKMGTFTALKEYLKSFIYSIMMKRPLYGLITYKIGKRIDSKIDLGNKFSFKEFRGPKWAKNLFRNNQKLFSKILLKQQQNSLKLTELLQPENIKNELLIQEGHNAYIFPLLVEKRDALFEEFLRNDIEPGRHFHKSIIWAKEFGYQNGMAPNAEKIVSQILTLPIHFGVHQKTIHKEAHIINNYGG